MKTIATLFSGFGGADIGAMAAGLTPVWANELRPDVAEVYRQNIGDHIVTGDMLDIDPTSVPDVDVLHASPPCTNASAANQAAEVNEDGTKESELDIALARKIIDFMTVKKPAIFTLENVWLYRKFKSFSIIENALWSLGYDVSFWHLNAANYGVPQTRKRLILIARRDGKRPQMPVPTHRKQADMFSPAWIGWHEAIEDLLPSLPSSQFAQWQLDRLPDELKTMLVHPTDFRTMPIRSKHASSFTVLAGDTLPRSFLSGGANTSKAPCSPGAGILLGDLPSMTLNTNAVMGWRCFLVDGTGNSNGSSVTVVDESQPAFTTVSNAFKKFPRAGLNNGHVVQLTPRCLARFQSFPDSYQLPANKALACYGIGNAVPPLLYQRIAEGL